MMATLGIITSAAYAGTELCAEFGKLPPSFLPIGHCRLYEQQVALLRSRCEQVVLTLPESFLPTSHDLDWLNAQQVEILFIPDGKTLSDSLLYAINTIESDFDQVCFLHGDTLFQDLGEFGADAVAVTSQQRGDYDWAIHQPDMRYPFREVAHKTHTSSIVVGFFHFAHVAHLRNALTRSNGDFLNALNRYNNRYPLKTVEASNWLDFGHLTLFYQAKNAILTQRSFNEIQFNKKTLTKTGQNHAKIRAEAQWFQNLPVNLRSYIPNLIGANLEANPPSYELEYLYYPLLANLYVFGRNRRATWESIFASCDEFMNGCQVHQAPVTPPYETASFYREKTLDRLATFLEQTPDTLDTPWRLNNMALPSLRQIVEDCCSVIPSPGHLRLVHGDFCFSNVFYDFRSESIKVIDPRGMTVSGEPSLWGDPRYDVAKMMHSVIGGYDHILAGYASINRQGNELSFDIQWPDHCQAIKAEFMGRTFGGFSPASLEIQAIHTLLFLSMLPLHADRPERQQCLLANGLRLYAGMDRLAFGASHSVIKEMVAG